MNDLKLAKSASIELYTTEQDDLRVKEKLLNERLNRHKTQRARSCDGIKKKKMSVASGASANLLTEMNGGRTGGLRRSHV